MSNKEWNDVSNHPQVALGEWEQVWVCIKNQKGYLRVQIGYYVNHPLPEEDNDGEYPDWAILNCDGEPADLVGFADLLSRPDYDGFFEPISGVVSWMPVEPPEAPEDISCQKQ